MSKQTANVKTEDENTTRDLKDVLMNEQRKEKEAMVLKEKGGMFVTDDAGRRYRFSKTKNGKPKGCIEMVVISKEGEEVVMGGEFRTSLKKGKRRDGSTIVEYSSDFRAEKDIGGMFVTDDAGTRYKVKKSGVKRMFSVENGGTQVNPDDVPPKGYMTDDDFARLLPYVEKTNKVLKVADKQYRASNRNVFDVVKQTYDALQQEKPEYLKAYKLLVDMDRSTINKIIKIVSNDIIMSNLDKLPVSWGTLCLLTSLKDDKLQSLIDAETITKSSTQSEIRLVKDGKTNSGNDYVNTTAYPNFMVIDLDVLSLSKKDRLKVEGLLSELTDYGFEIAGVAKEVA